MDKTFKPPSRRKTDGTRFDFRFQFHATRVPNSGWDKLVVSLISVETGKTAVKTSRGHVRNGICQWPDPVIESTRITPDLSTGGYDEKSYRLLVQMGSLRVGILGEATINLSDYINADSPDTLSLPLRNCNAGTILHVQVQCLTPKTSSREFERQRSSSIDREELGSVSEDDDTGSDLSENLTVASVGSSASQTRSKRSYLQNSQSQIKDLPSSLATSRNSFDSFDSLTYGNNSNNGQGRNFTNMDAGPLPDSANNLPRRPNSAASRDSSNGQESSRSSYAQNTKHQGGVGIGHPSKGWQDAFNWQADHTNPSLGTFPPENGTRVASSIPPKLEAAEATIQELRLESSSWERRARKLHVEVETLKQQLSTEVKNGAEHKMEMSALEAERDSLILEGEQLKAMKLASKKRENGEDLNRWEVEDSKRLIKALQEEISYEKEVNTNLHLQLHKTQDANQELVSAVTEIEETIELRNVEINRLGEANDQLQDQLCKAQDSNAELIFAVKELEETLQQRNTGTNRLTNDTQETYIASDNDNYRLTLDNGEAGWSREEVDWQKKFKAAEANFVQQLGKRDQEFRQLEAKLLSHENEAEKKNDLFFNDAKWMEKLRVLETEFMQKLMEKDQQIKELLSKLVLFEDGASKTGRMIQPVDNNFGEDCLQTIEVLKRRLNDQEMDCNELTDENIDLLCKLDRANKELDSKMKLIAELEGSLETTTSSEHWSGKEKAEEQVLIDELESQVTELKRKNALLQQQLDTASMMVGDLPDKEEQSREWLHRGLEFPRSVVNILQTEERDDRDGKVGRVRLDSSEEVHWKSVQEESLGLEEKCSHFQQNLSCLDEENGYLKAELKQAAMSKAEVEDMVHDLQKEKEELESQLQGLELENSQINVRIREHDAEIAQLRNTVEVHMASEKRLDREVAERCAEVEKLIQELANRVASEKKLEAKWIEVDNERGLLETKVQDLKEQRGLSKSRIEELEFQIPILSDEIKLLNASKNEYERIALKLEMEKTEIQEKLEEAQDESRADRERLNELVGQMTALTTTLDSQLIAKRTLERRASELEKDKEELETQVLDLEEQNLQLSERISGLEAQLRYVSEERESYKLEMENVQAQSLTLQSEKRMLEITFQEVLGGHRRQVAEMEQQLACASREAENYSQIKKGLAHELEQQKEGVSTLKLSHCELEKSVADLQCHRALLEEQLQEAVDERASSKAKCTALEAELSQQQREGEQRERDLKMEVEKMIRIKDDFEHRAKKAQEALAQLQEEKVAAVDHLQSELQRFSEQMSSTFDEKEKLASGALIEASELRAEKLELEDSLKCAHERVKNIQEDSAALQKRLESRLDSMASEVDSSKKSNVDLTQMLHRTQNLLEGMTAAGEDDKLKIQKLEKELLDLEQERQLLLKEQTELRRQASELVAVKTEMENMKGMLDQMSSEKSTTESSFENVAAQYASLQQEKSLVVEKLTSLEVVVSEIDELKRHKAALEEKLVRFQSLLEAQEAGKIQEAEQRNELIRLRRHMSQLQRKLVEQEEGKNEFQRRVEYLEEEVLHKTDALAKSEKQMKAASAVGRSMDRSNSKLGVASPAKEVLELRERLLCLEVDAKAREEELESCKREFMEREFDLCKKIEHLELSNEQLAVGLIDSGADQLQKELIRLQNQNSFLSRREQELLSKMHTQEVLQAEVQRLQEGNDLLEARLTKFMETAKNPYLLEKIVNLETELAEATEANNMYKLQLRSFFDKQQNVSMAALQGLGDLDQVINDLFKYKKVATQLENELRGMHERYSLVSLQLAEAEAERGELIISLKNVKSNKKI